MFNALTGREAARRAMCLFLALAAGPQAAPAGDAPPTAAAEPARQVEIIEPLFVRPFAPVETGRNDGNPLWARSGMFLSFERSIGDRKEVRIALADAARCSRRSTTCAPPPGRCGFSLASFKKVFINAHITERTGDLVPMKEGCLSLPNIREEVKRESHIRIKYFDENWNDFDEVYDGYKARVIQHEYDHLDGKLFVEKVNPLKRQLLKGKLADISKGKFDADYKTLVYIPRKK